MVEHFRFGPVLDQNKQPNLFFKKVFEPNRIENRFKLINFGLVQFGFFPFQTGSNQNYWPHFPALLFLKLNKHNARDLRDETLKQGIESPSKDLETLKHILEALQLKGLLHSKKPTNQTNQINFVYEETPVVLMKPASMNRPDERLEDWKRRRQNRRGQYSGWLES